MELQLLLSSNVPILPPDTALHACKKRQVRCEVPTGPARTKPLLLYDQKCRDCLGCPSRLRRSCPLRLLIGGSRSRQQRQRNEGQCAYCGVVPVTETAKFFSETKGRQEAEEQKELKLGVKQARAVL